MSDLVCLKSKLKVGIRWAVVTDASAIAKLELQSAVYENRAHPFTFTHSQFTYIWVDRLKSLEYKTILAYDDHNEILGFLTFKGLIEQGKILALYIAPKYMRKGVGKLLLSTACQMVGIKGGNSIEVEVEVLNNGAIAFYNSLLFNKVSVKLGHLIVMKKEL